MVVQLVRPHLVQLEPAQVMVRLRFCSVGGYSVSRDHPRDTTSRAIQRQLCADFGRAFPASKVVLVLNNFVFDDFECLPFRDCPEDATFQVVFIATDDPYFYDLMQRKGTHLTLAEEIAAEASEQDPVATICGSDKSG